MSETSEPRQTVPVSSAMGDSPDPPRAYHIARAIVKVKIANVT